MSFQKMKNLDRSGFRQFPEEILIRHLQLLSAVYIFEKKTSKQVCFCQDVCTFKRMDQQNQIQFVRLVYFQVLPFENAFVSGIKYSLLVLSASGQTNISHEQFILSGKIKLPKLVLILVCLFCMRGGQHVFITLCPKIWKFYH